MKYTAPEMKIVRFEAEEVIVASTNTCSNYCDDTIIDEGI